MIKLLLNICIICDILQIKKGVQYPDIALMERENEICIRVDFSVKELHRNVNCFYKLIINYVC